MGVPGGGVELKRKDDVICVAYLADEASLRAEVTMMHVVGGELDLRLQEGLILTICYLQKRQWRK